MSPVFENFEQAFRGGVNGCRQQCECGVTYYDTYNTNYDWEEGELEELEKMHAEGTARPLDHAVGFVMFEGHRYVDGCACWHDRAKRIISFILNHDEAIAQFLSLEKKRKTRDAERSPVVSG